jgi:hypothetical protein
LDEDRDFRLFQKQSDAAFLAHDDLKTQAGSAGFGDMRVSAQINKSTNQQINK